LSLWSGAAGFIPLPLVDIAAVWGVQLQMLRRLSEIYGVPFSENRGKSTYHPRGIGDPSDHRDRFGQRHEERAHNRNGDWRADDASGGRGRHLGNRKGFHQAFCFGWNASRFQSTGLSRVHKAAKGEIRCSHAAHSLGYSGQERDDDGRLVVMHNGRLPVSLGGERMRRREWRTPGHCRWIAPRE
jgi:uncharacterized protein DUF697